MVYLEDRDHSQVMLRRVAALPTLSPPEASVTRSVAAAGRALPLLPPSADTLEPVARSDTASTAVTASTFTSLPIRHRLSRPPTSGRSRILRPALIAAS